MNKLYCVVSLLLASFSLAATNNITYKKNALIPGDVRSMEQVEFPRQGESGPNQIWNFSGAKAIGPMVISQSTNSNQSIGSLDLTSKNSLLACDEGGEKTSYFEISTSGKNYWGLISKSGVSIQFNAPITDLPFPFAYDDIITGSMDGSYVVDDKSYPIQGNYFTSADAYGSLTLPDGSYYPDVLRVKVEKFYEQNESSINYTIHTVRYQYYAQGVRYPVFIALDNDIKSDCNCACGSDHSQLAYYTPKNNVILSSAGEKILSPSSKVSPVVRVVVTENPLSVGGDAKVKITTSVDCDAVISLSDTKGHVLKNFGSHSLVEGDNNLVLSCSYVSAGIYFLHFTVGGVNITKTIIIR